MFKPLLSLMIVPFIFLSACDEPPAEKIKELIAASSPQMSAENITFDGCELSMELTAKAEGSEFLTRYLTRIDLANYDLTRGSINVAESGVATISVKRRPTRRRMAKQAMRILEVFPKDQDIQEGRLTMVSPAGQAVVENRLSRDEMAPLSEQDIIEVLSKDGGQLTFGLTSVVVGGGKIEPHKDGSSFERFAKSIGDLQKPTTFSLSILYQGNAASPDSLVSGTVVAMPAIFRATAVSKDKAVELGKALHAYQQENC